VESSKGEAVSDLIEQLEKKSRKFNFFQAVALLEEYFQKNDTTVDPLNSGKIRFSPDSSTAFPPSDIASIKVDRNESINFLLSFMGLLGVSSPLPQYFSEYATKQESNQIVLSDFLTIFNHRIYVFFYRAWKKYRLVSNISKQVFSELLHNIAILSGLNENKITTNKKLFAYTGIFAQTCRSAEGLKTVLSNYFGDIPISIQQWIPRWAPVPEKNLKKVGADSVLGKSSMIGTHIYDIGGKFKITLGPLEKETFETFLPEKPNTEMLKEITNDYLTDPLEFDIEVKLKPADLVPVVLGNDDAQIGISASCGSSSEKGDPYTITFQ
jgi:type VI secretion system protein ImpH